MFDKKRARTGDLSRAEEGGLKWMCTYDSTVLETFFVLIIGFVVLRFGSMLSIEPRL